MAVPRARRRQSGSAVRRFIERELPALACGGMVGLLGRRAAAACLVSGPVD